MSSNDNRRTPFVCRLERFRIAVFGNEAQSTHIHGCLGCQHVLRSQNALESALRKEARASRVEVPPFLEQRILRSIRNSSSSTEPETRREPSRLRGWIPALAACGIAVGLWLTVARQFEPEREGSSRSVAAVPAESPVHNSLATLQTNDTTGDSTTAGLLDLGSWSLWMPKAEGVLGAEPLETEARAVVADARAAIQFLATNFLPVSSSVLSDE